MVQTPPKGMKQHRRDEQSFKLKEIPSFQPCSREMISPQQQIPRPPHSGDTPNPGALAGGMAGGEQSHYFRAYKAPTIPSLSTRGITMSSACLCNYQSYFQRRQPMLQGTGLSICNRRCSQWGVLIYTSLSGILFFHRSLYPPSSLSIEVFCQGPKRGQPSPPAECMRDL